jgi:hypothetical protein
MYAEVTVIIDGAVETEEIYHDQVFMDHCLESIAEDALGHGYPTEVYIMYHDHAFGMDCECIQYVADHRPVFQYNMEVGV